MRGARAWCPSGGGLRQGLDRKAAAEGEEEEEAEGARRTIAGQVQELLARHQQAAATAAGAGAQVAGSLGAGALHGAGELGSGWRGLQEVVAAVAEERVDATRREVGGTAELDFRVLL